jgi:hypothetical protein
MSHHLMINDASGSNWRVPDGADPYGLLDQIRAAMENGSVIEVAVQTNDAEPKNVKLTINGAAVATATIVTI